MVLGAESAGRMAVFSGFYNYDTPSEADRLEVTRLKWDNSKWRFLPDLGEKVATVLAVGSFSSPAAARKFKKTDTAGCVSSYMVLSSSTIKSLPPGHCILGKVYSLNDLAQIESDKQQLLQCGVKLKLSVVDILSSPMPYEMRE